MKSTTTLLTFLLIGIKDLQSLLKFQMNLAKVYKIIKYF